MGTESYQYAINAIKNKKEYINYNENIRITESNNYFKRVVARAISDYLSAISRPWDTIYKEDINAKLLAKHLNNMFPEFKDGWEFRTIHSQGTFDIVCLGANVIIEMKAVNRRNKRFVSNASVYPDTVTVKNALSKKFTYPETNKDIKNTVLDVLVVCVSYKKDIINGFAIVDGHYWDINERLYVDCHKYFGDLNKHTDKINELLSENNTFAAAMLDGTLGNAVSLKLRKLIELTNPIGRLNVLGKWGIVF